MRVLLLVGQCHVEVEGAGSLYWLDLLHMGPSPSPHWLCLLHNGPLEPNPLPSNPCLTLLPCVPSPVNTHLAFKRLQVPAFHSLQILNLWIPLHISSPISSPSCGSSASLSCNSTPLLGVPLPALPTAAASTPTLIHAPLACPSLAAIVASAPHHHSSLVATPHPSVADSLPSSVQFPCNHGKGTLH